MLAAALMFAAMFAYISGSSFVLQEDYGLSAQQFSLIFAANGLGIVLLGQVNGFLIGRAATERTLLRVSLTVASLGGLGVLLIAGLGLPLPLLLAGLFVVVSMIGIVLPNATSLAMAGYRDAAGAASSLQGLLQFGVGAIAASAMGLAGQGTAVPMGVTMAGCAIGALGCVARRGGHGGGDAGSFGRKILILSGRGGRVGLRRTAADEVLPVQLERFPAAVEVRGPAGGVLQPLAAVAAPRPDRIRPGQPHRADGPGRRQEQAE